METRKRAEVYPEGGAGSWWYVCEECHCAVNYKAAICPHCKSELSWEGVDIQSRKVYTGEQTEPAE